VERRPVRPARPAGGAGLDEELVGLDVPVGSRPPRGLEPDAVVHRGGRASGETPAGSATAEP